MRRHNLAFIDTETTGLNADKHEIIQIGCVVVSQTWDNGRPSQFEVLEEIELKIKPENLKDADPVALRVNGYNEADWIFAHDLKTAMGVLAKATADSIMVSHNITFDYAFLEKAFRKTGIENRMHFHKLDTISLAFAKLHAKEDVERFSLQFLCDYFGIENKKAHTALSDARATFELYKKLMAL
jgi:DNA polymerase III epsilon subunit-like protein